MRWRAMASSPVVNVMAAVLFGMFAGMLLEQHRYPAPSSSLPPMEQRMLLGRNPSIHHPHSHSAGRRGTTCHAKIAELQATIVELKVELSPSLSLSSASLPLFPSSPAQPSSTDMIDDPWRALLSSIDGLASVAENLRFKYRHAAPFPHVVIDGLFPDALLRAVGEENPEICPVSSSGDDGTSGSNSNGGGGGGGFGPCDAFPQSHGCVKGSTQCFSKEKRGKGRNREYRKSTKDRDGKIPPASRMLLAGLKSSGFVAFLEQLSGVDALLPDPHYTGAGLHFTSFGGLLAVHADFNKLERHGLDRRVNVFVFLNDDWDADAYGGHLELWDRNMTSCVQRIAPIFGRVVVFSTTDFSYHGHPAKLTAPPHRVRRSVAMYYYTNGRPSDECIDGDCGAATRHNTIWKQLPGQCARCEDAACRRFPLE